MSPCNSIFIACTALILLCQIYRSTTITSFQRNPLDAGAYIINCSSHSEFIPLSGVLLTQPQRVTIDRRHFDPDERFVYVFSTFNISPKNILILSLLQCGDIQSNPGPNSDNSSKTSNDFKVFNKRGLYFVHVNTRSLLPKLNNIRLIARRSKKSLSLYT